MQTSSSFRVAIVCRRRRPAPLQISIFLPNTRYFIFPRILMPGSKSLEGFGTRGGVGPEFRHAKAQERIEEAVARGHARGLEEPLLFANPEVDGLGNDVNEAFVGEGCQRFQSVRVPLVRPLGYAGRPLARERAEGGSDAAARGGDFG